jgi:hypothetical protein
VKFLAGDGHERRRALKTDAFDSRLGPAIAKVVKQRPGTRALKRPFALDFNWFFFNLANNLNRFNPRHTAACARDSMCGSKRKQ